MKKTEIYNKIKEEGILTDAFKFNDVEFMSGFSSDMNLKGVYDSYSSSLCSYEAYEYFYICDAKMGSIVRLPFSVYSCYAQGDDVIASIKDAEISEAIKAAGFDIKYVIHVSKHETCQDNAHYSAYIYNNVCL